MTREFRITGKHVLFAMIAFFAVIVAVNAVFMTLAIDTFPGEHEKKSYLQGLHYNDVLSERAEQAALGWTMAITRLEAAGEETIVEVELRNADGAPISGLTVTGMLSRPATDGEDRELAFRPIAGADAYRAQTPALRPGAWDLAATAEAAGGETYETYTRLIVE